MDASKERSEESQRGPEGRNELDVRVEARWIRQDEAIDHQGQEVIGGERPTAPTLGQLKERDLA